MPYFLRTVGLQGVEGLEMGVLRRPDERFVLPDMSGRRLAGIDVCNLGSAVAGRCGARAGAVIFWLWLARFLLGVSRQRGDATQKNDCRYP